MPKKTRETKGITLIALVVTIIVLLLLAGISISMLTGENGILTRAKEAKIRTTHQTVYEELKMQGSEYTMSKTMGEYDQGLMDYLKEKQYVEEQTDTVYLVNVPNLIGKQSLGNGTDGETDVYKLEQIVPVAEAIALEVGEQKPERIEYELKYYGKNPSENVDIGKLIDTVEGTKSGEEEIESIDYYYLYSDAMPLNPDESPLKLKLIYLDKIREKYAKKANIELPNKDEITEEEIFVYFVNDWERFV